MTVRVSGDLGRLKKHLASLLGSSRPGVKVGVLDGAKYSEGPLAGEPVAGNLARHEFGTKHIPARAPFRGTLEKRKSAWVREAVPYLKASAGKVDVQAALSQVGELAAMDIQQSFEDGLDPALKPATIEQKKRITREGTLAGKNGRGKNRGEYRKGDYAANAATPVMLTGTAQRAITSEYVDDISPFLE